MKAIITSIGERTTDICRDFLESWGFEVCLYEKIEPWPDKYRRIISRMEEDFVRIDADCIPLPYIKELAEYKGRAWLVQMQHLDFYTMQVKFGLPVLYRREATEEIRRNIDKLDPRRPETSAWRLPNLVDKTENRHRLCAMHGFFQYQEDIERGILHRKDRGQDAGNPEIIRRFMDLTYNPVKAK